MSRQDIFVELMTPSGKVFSGTVSAIEFSQDCGVVQMEPGNVVYHGLIAAGEITLRLGNEFRCFALVHASASVQPGRLTVLAEDIRPIAAPIGNCVDSSTGLGSPPN